jgi:NADPH:quinone reductase-like Zn-dependent oxidoreductase
VLLATKRVEPNQRDPTPRESGWSKVSEMGATSTSWTLPASQAATERPLVASERSLAAALGRCGSLVHRSVLFVDAGAGLPAEAMLLARREGARVTALVASPEAQRALDAGAELVLDPARTDPAWYRGAWSVIVDPYGRMGFRHARPSAPSIA